MPKEITEADWNIFEELHAIAMDRFFQNAVDEIRPLLIAPNRTAQERFWDTLRLANQRREEAADIFDDSRRSVAVFMATAIYRRKLITEDEFSRFSQALRENVRQFLGVAEPSRPE